MIPPNPMQVASFAERVSKETGGKLGLVFSVVTAVTLCVVSAKMLHDMVKERRSCKV